MHFGVPDSKMIRHYSKLCDEDTEKEALERSGVVMLNKTEQPRPSICPKCDEPCAPGAKFCPECGEPLSRSAANSVREAEKAVERLPEFELFKRVMSNPQAIELLKQIDDKTQK